MIERFELAPGYTISRVIKGSWQLAGGHGAVSRSAAIEDMRQFVDAGITTFDCADIYTGVESLIGAFLRSRAAAGASARVPSVQVHTKYVPDLDQLATLGPAEVRSSVERSLRRLNVEQLDLVQFHWWDYTIPGYVDAALWLRELQLEGKIRHIGTTNFDVGHLAEIVDAGVPIISNQVQYSLLDRRPEGAMTEYCREHNITLLCYGTVAGGLLSDRFLGADEPSAPLENRSLTKYKLIADEFGSWSSFQRLLAGLRGIAEKHDVRIAMVASQAILQKTAVGGVILGARHSRHLRETKRLGTFKLDADDLLAIRDLTAHAAGPAGPVYALERDRTGPHGRIMHYNLHQDHFP